MRKVVAILACTVFVLGLIACNAEPKNELWKQFESTENPEELFADVGVEEIVLLEDNGYKLITAEAESSKSEKYDGFCFPVGLENANEEDVLFTFAQFEINGVDVSMEHLTCIAITKMGLEIYPGVIVVKYEDLARNNISAIENISCVMEVYEAVIDDEKSEEGTNSTYLERGDLLYTSPEITFEMN